MQIHLNSFPTPPPVVTPLVQKTALVTSHQKIWGIVAIILVAITVCFLIKYLRKFKVSVKQAEPIDKPIPTPINQEKEKPAEPVIHAEVRTDSQQTVEIENPPEVAAKPQPSPLSDKCGTLEGEGTRTTSGVKMEGTFKRGLLYGQGKKTFDGGAIHEGLFKANVLVNGKIITQENGKQTIQQVINHKVQK